MSYMDSWVGGFLEKNSNVPNRFGDVSITFTFN